MSKPLPRSKPKTPPPAPAAKPQPEKKPKVKTPKVGATTHFIIDELTTIPEGVFDELTPAPVYVPDVASGRVD